MDLKPTIVCVCERFTRLRNRAHVGSVYWRVLSEPFRGSAAVAGGLVSRKRLRGPSYRRLFHDVYLAAEVAATLEVRARAAHLLVAGHGALGGWSAAELLGASCGPADAPVEVITAVHRRPQPGLRVRRECIPSDEVATLDGITLTSALRTAFDLGRRSPLREAVVAVDALARQGVFAPTDLLEVSRRHLGARGSGLLAQVLTLSNPLAGSPMETRIRLAIVADGLPVPVLQYPVGPYLLDLAYPPIRLAIEYDGREHLTQERAMRDLDRQAYLTAAGWTKVLRFRAREVHRPDVVARAVRRELIGFARRNNLTFPEVLGMICPKGT